MHSQPRSGVFCALINEARQTIPLEMPDKENTFVLKANDQEYVIEAKDATEMKSWLATIRYCMKTTPTSQLPPLPLTDTSNTSITNSSLIGDTASALPNNAQPSSSSSTTANAHDATVNNNNHNNNNVNSTNNNQPELPPRRPESSGHFHLEEEDLLHDSDLTAMMSEYPW